MFAQDLQGVAQEWQKKLEITERLKQKAEEKMSKLGGLWPHGADVQHRA